jgi:two-component system chemotaxis response regulator CheB
MAEAPIRVVIVDDSAFTRRAIARILAADPGVRVVAEAAEGEEALRRLAETAADVVTLDLDMPTLDGLGMLRRVREVSQAPVVVLSARGAPEARRRALELGAFAVLPKPSGGAHRMHEAGRTLLAALHAAAGRRPPEPPGPAPTPGAYDLVMIGVSTGGPAALQQVVPALPAGFRAPVVVLQHMPAGHTRRLAARLDALSALGVREAEPGDALVPGQVLVAPAGSQLGLRRGPAGLQVEVAAGASVASYYRPCIDHAFAQAARLLGGRLLALVMTGMGRDGAEGLAAVKAAGGTAWAQDVATSAMAGMPRAAAELVRLDEVLPLERIAGRLAAAINTAGRPPAAP